MDGLGLHARSLAHPLGGPSGGSGQQNMQSQVFQCGDDTLGRGGLARAGSARQDHDLGAKGFLNGLQLHLVIRDACFFGQFRCIEPSRKEIAFRFTEQGKQAVGRAHLGKVERRQVDGFILYLQVFRPCRAMSARALRIESSSASSRLMAAFTSCSSAYTCPSLASWFKV